MLIKDLVNDESLIGQQITVDAWVRSRRDSKAGVSFIELYDGSCLETLQLVAADTLPEYQSMILKLTPGCSLQASGLVVASQGGKQVLEVQLETIKVYGWVDEPDKYPMAKKRHTMEHLREHAHLRPRTNMIAAVTRVRTVLANAVHQFFFQRDFHWINTPIITSSDCEGAGEMFRVSSLDLNNLPLNAGKVDFAQDFFSKEAYLTVSGQLNVEAYCLAMSKVYTFGPTFRAENSNTSRHLAEFWMVEPEIAFADLDDDIDLAEDFLKYVIADVLEHCEADLAFFDQFVQAGLLEKLRNVIDQSFERMEYSDAIDTLRKCEQKFEYPVAWGVDLQSEHERYLAESLCKKPVVLMNYPKDIKAFYMRLNDDEKTVAAMDVLAPGIGEIIGGSQREERLSVLDERMQAQGLEGDLDWYRDLRRYGTVPHAGFGLGFERLLNYVTGVENIRDVIPYPRSPRHAEF